MSDLVREYAFLSYAHEDLDLVRKLYKGLKERKVNAWFDKVDLGPGRVKQGIKKAISRSRYFIFCLSEASLKKINEKNRTFVDDELQTAWEFATEQDEKSFTIIPVRLEDCDRGDMRLSGWQQYDLFKDWESVLDTIAVNIGGKSLSDASAIDERTEDERILDGIRGKAEIFNYAGEYDKALSLLEVAKNFKPNDPKVWFQKGKSLAALDRHEKALEAYEKSIGINPDNPGVWAVWFQKGKSLASVGRHDEALEAYPEFPSYKLQKPLKSFN
jgi:tetratricopeptide (TPR) repeat protein